MQMEVKKQGEREGEMKREREEEKKREEKKNIARGGGRGRGEEGRITKIFPSTVLNDLVLFSVYVSAMDFKFLRFIKIAV
jgi:hypothetical protein